jgi:hypothetical protein
LIQHLCDSMTAMRRYLLALLLLTWAISTKAQTYISGSVTGAYAINSSGATLSTPLHLTPGAGHLLVCGATWQSATATATMSDPNNGTWLAIGSPEVGANTLSGYSGQMFYVTSAVASATTVTLTVSAAVLTRLFECNEYSYTGTLSIDGTPQYSNTPSSGSAAIVTGLTTTQSSDMLFAGCLGITTGFCSAGGGFTARNDTNALNAVNSTTGNNYVSVTGQTNEELGGVPAGTQSATFATSTATVDVILGMVAFHATGTPGAPVITSPTTASGTVGSSFSYQITATNSPTSFGASNLPPGLSVNSSTGLISGTPTATGTTASSISATNASGTGSGSLTITISSGGGGTIINAADCSQAQVVIALGKVTQDGTTVILPACNITWGATSASSSGNASVNAAGEVVYSSNFSTIIKGQSTVTGNCTPTSTSCTATDSTIITINTASPGRGLTITTVAGKSFELTGVTFLTSSTKAAAFGSLNINGGSTSVRVDHNHFNDQTSGEHLLELDSFNGVFDHNFFDSTNRANLIFLHTTAYGPSGLGNEVYTQPDNFGTSSFIFVENNLFQNGTFAFDSGAGGSMVFRYNVVGNNTRLQTHGTLGPPVDSAGRRGSRSLEVYGNSFTFNPNPNGNDTSTYFPFVMDYESGTGLWWNNNISGFQIFLREDTVRTNTATYTETATPNGWGYCGTSASGTGSNWDGSATGNGYPCLDQLGRGQGQLINSAAFPGRLNTSTGTIAWPQQALHPIYVWGNKFNTFPNITQSYWNNFDTVTVENRDYYLELPNLNEAGSFTGAAGVGCGPASGVGCNNPVAQPGTCTNGTAYWQTATQTLQLCSSNTFSNYYSPFTYPHPLTTGGGGGPTPPNPPSGLTATASGTTINLSWTASAGSPIPTGYSVYRSTTSGGPYNLVASGLTGTTYADPGLANNTYFYVVTAFFGGVISNINGSGTTATVTCSAACTFASGNSANISGNSVAGFNGTFTVTGATSNTFTYASTTTGTGTGGGAWISGAESTRSNQASAVVGATLTLSITPSSLTFPSTTVGQSTPAQTITVTNTSSAGNSVTISSVALTGANPGDFNILDPLSSSFTPSINTNCASYPSNIWVTDTMTKLLQNTGNVGACPGPSGNKWITVHGTQNEFVDFQVHYHDSGAGTTGLNFTVSNFTQTAPSSFTINCATQGQCIAYREAYINVNTHVSSISATYYNQVGFYPDPLIPPVDPYHGQTTSAWPFNVTASQNQSAWVDIHVPANAPSGYYSGSVTVSNSGGTLAVLPIIIAVWQWPSAGSMPAQSSLGYAMGTSGFSDLCVQAYGSYSSCSSYPGSGGSNDTAVTLMDIDFGKLMADHRIGSGSLTYPPPTTNFTAYETNFGPLLNGTSPTLITGAKWSAAQYTPGTGNLGFVQNWMTEFKNQNWLPNTLFTYSCDEPPSGCAWASINTTATSLHASNPPMPGLVTTNLANATTNGVLNGIDIMVPIINDLDPQGGSSQRSSYNAWLAGTATPSGPKRLIWSYQSCESTGTCSNGTVGGAQATWPNYNIDGKPAANRAMEWMSYRNQVSGELYYSATGCWLANSCSNGSIIGNDPWASYEYSFGGWGNGTFVYPGITGKVGTITTPFWVPNILLKQVRDGMQDYEYMVVLNAKGQGSTVNSAINSWITNSSTFETSGTGLEAAKTTLGNAMHALTFAAGSSCTTTLASGASCQVNVVFTPTAPGSRTASVTFTDNAQGSPQNVLLTGTGAGAVPGASLTPSAIIFGAQLVSTTSVAAQVTLINTGTGTLTVSSITPTGDFAVSSTVPSGGLCGGSLAPSVSCTINVTFTPTVTGTRSGALTVTDNAPSSPQTTTLSGTGINTKCSLTNLFTLSGSATLCGP